MAKKRRASAKLDKSGAGGPTAGPRRRTAAGRAPRETRARMSGGAHRVEAQGSARRLLAEAREAAVSVGQTTVGTARGIAGGARDAAVGVARTTGRTASQVADGIKRNPWPALLIGAGATWVAIDAIRGESEDARGDKRRPTRRRSQGAGHMAQQAASAVADAGRTVGGAVADAGRTVGGAVADASRTVGGRVEQFVRDNPMLAGAATLGLGVAVGMALPGTEQENSLFGHARNEVVGRAKEAARGTVRGVRDAVESMQRYRR